MRVDVVCEEGFNASFQYQLDPALMMQWKRANQPETL
jgi:hypothetical protein